MANKEPNVNMETVTPALAQQYLRSMAVNRDFRPQHAETLKRAYLSGDFMNTGDPLKFNTKGELIDGQHRCFAIAASGKTVRMAVARGVEDKAILVIDTGSKRRIGDTLKVTGEHNYFVLAGATQILIAASDGRMLQRSGNYMVSTAEVVHALEKFPELRESAAFASNNSDLKKLVFPAVVAGLHLLFSKASSVEKAEEFFNKLATGANLGVNNPILVLRNRILEERSNIYQRLNRVLLMAWIIKAWNKWITGGSMKLLKYEPLREEYPTIEGLPKIKLGLTINVFNNSRMAKKNVKEVIGGNGEEK